MNRLIPPVWRRLFASFVLWMLLHPGFAAAQHRSFPLVTNLQELRGATTWQQGQICVLDLSGTVLGADSNSGTLFLADSFGTEALEMDFRGQVLVPGQKIRLQGTNYVARTEIGLSLGRRPVIDSDELHPAVERDQTVYLEAGRHPLRVTWFNKTSTAFLKMDYSGPDLSPQKIPDSALFHSDGTAHWLGGLNYRYFEGRWEKLPDFSTLSPVKTGFVSNFDINVKTREENVGLEFEGFINVTNEGNYTFCLTSDDGSQLFLYSSPPLLTAMGTAPVPLPRRITTSQPLSGEPGGLWAEVDGTVTFLSKQGKNLEMELGTSETRMRVDVLNAPKEIPESLLHSRLLVRGICPDIRDGEGHKYAGLMVVPDWQSIQVLEEGQEQGAAPRGTNTDSGQTNRLITTAIQVQQMSREMAQKEYPVKLRGVITSVDFRTLRIQDSTRAVFVLFGSDFVGILPKVGQYCQIEGFTEPADFSPIVILKKATVLWEGQMPRPVIPTRDQLLSGSLDAQYVEIRGLVAATNATYISLLTSDGMVDLKVFPDPSESWESLLGSLVRIRGCLLAGYDNDSHHVLRDIPIELLNATVAVDTMPPQNAFDADKVRARELMQFDVRSDTFRRVRVSGQILHQSPGMYYAMDEATGLRFRTSQALQFEPGDNVEVVGLLELGGASPILRQAVARKTGHSPLPQPRQLFLDKLNDDSDSTRVWVEGILVDSKQHGLEQVIELQVGVRSFAARLPIKGSFVSPWAIGSRLRLTGVFCALDGNQQARHNVNSFELLLNSPADVQVVARPTWWTLGRLMVMVALLFVGLGLAFVWITLLRRQVERRTIQLKREMSERERAEQWRVIEEERSRIARDLHDDLGSQLTELSMLAVSPRLKLKPETAPARLLEIADKSQSMITALDRLVWVINSKNDTLSALIEYMASYFEEFLAKTEIGCRVELPKSYTDRSIAAEIRNHVLLSVREALNNAVRHGRPTEVLLRLVVAERGLEILIQDNGCGFDPGRGGLGNGLTNLQERMSSLNGWAEIKSSPGQGSSILLKLPLSAAVAAPAPTPEPV